MIDSIATSGLHSVTYSGQSGRTVNSQPEQQNSEENYPVSAGEKALSRRYISAKRPSINFGRMRNNKRRRVRRLPGKERLKVLQLLNRAR